MRLICLAYFMLHFSFLAFAGNFEAEPWDEKDLKNELTRKCKILSAQEKKVCEVDAESLLSDLSHLGKEAKARKIRFSQCRFYQMEGNAGANTLTGGFNILKEMSGDVPIQKDYEIFFNKLKKLGGEWFHLGPLPKGMKYPYFVGVPSVCIGGFKKLNTAALFPSFYKNFPKDKLDQLEKRLEKLPCAEKQGPRVYSLLLGQNDVVDILYLDSQGQSVFVKNMCNNEK